jgi:hypothetical protein
MEYHLQQQKTFQTFLKEYIRLKLQMATVVLLALTYITLRHQVYDKVLESALKVYPNPVQNVLTLEYDGKESKMNIQIVDGLGRKIITERYQPC